LINLPALPADPTFDSSAVELSGAAFRLALDLSLLPTFLLLPSGLASNLRWRLPSSLNLPAFFRLAPSVCDPVAFGIYFELALSVFPQGRLRFRSSACASD
jgi:hypothetical protein